LGQYSTGPDFADQYFWDSTVQGRILRTKNLKIFACGAQVTPNF